MWCNGWKDVFGHRWSWIKIRMPDIMSRAYALKPSHASQVLCHHGMEMFSFMSSPHARIWLCVICSPCRLLSQRDLWHRNKNFWLNKNSSSKQYALWISRQPQVLMLNNDTPLPCVPPEVFWHAVDCDQIFCLWKLSDAVPEPKKTNSNSWMIPEPYLWLPCNEIPSKMMTTLDVRVAEN